MANLVSRGKGGKRSTQVKFLGGDIESNTLPVIEKKNNDMRKAINKGTTALELEQVEAFITVMASADNYLAMNPDVMAQVAAFVYANSVDRMPEPAGLTADKLNEYIRALIPADNGRDPGQSNKVKTRMQAELIRYIKRYYLLRTMQ